MMRSGSNPNIIYEQYLAALPTSKEIKLDVETLEDKKIISSVFFLIFKDGKFIIVADSYEIIKQRKLEIDNCVKFQNIGYEIDKKLKSGTPFESIDVDQVREYNRLSAALVGKDTIDERKEYWNFLSTRQLNIEDMKIPLIAPSSGAFEFYLIKDKNNQIQIKCVHMMNSHPYLLSCIWLADRNHEQRQQQAIRVQLETEYQQALQAQSAEQQIQWQAQLEAEYQQALQAQLEEQQALAEQQIQLQAQLEAELGLVAQLEEQQALQTAQIEAECQQALQAAQIEAEYQQALQAAQIEAEYQQALEAQEEYQQGLQAAQIETEYQKALQTAQIEAECQQALQAAQIEAEHQQALQAAQIEAEYQQVPARFEEGFLGQAATTNDCSIFPQADQNSIQKNEHRFIIEKTGKEVIVFPDCSKRNKEQYYHLVGTKTGSNLSKIKNHPDFRLSDHKLIFSDTHPLVKNGSNCAGDNAYAYIKGLIESGDEGKKKLELEISSRELIKTTRVYKRSKQLNSAPTNFPPRLHTDATLSSIQEPKNGLELFSSGDTFNSFFGGSSLFTTRPSKKRKGHGQEEQSNLEVEGPPSKYLNTSG